MKANLTQFQRVIVAIIYFLLLLCVYLFLGNDPFHLLAGASEDSSLWFFSGFLLIILGGYIAEPFYTRPADAIPNAAAIIIALYNLKDRDSLIFYDIILYFALTVLFFSIITIGFKDFKNKFIIKVRTISYYVSSRLGHNKVIFSVVYLPSAYSYFNGKVGLLFFAILLWVCIIFFDIVGKSVEKIASFFVKFKSRGFLELGQAIGCDNPLLYKIEVDYAKHEKQNVNEGDIVCIETELNKGAIGIIINIKHLLSKKWLAVYLLKHENEVIYISIKNKKIYTDTKSIFSQDKFAFLIKLDELDKHVNDKITENFFFKNRYSFIGYIEKDSNINSVNISILANISLPNKSITEGTILTTNIYQDIVLYQVINGETMREHLENFDTYGFTICVARKIGKYDHVNKELKTQKWMPDIYSPVFKLDINEITEEKLKEISINSLGRLPETDLQIPIKDINSIVTHNTAILGILGIGKSQLAFEIIKKIITSEVKIICIDISNQYYSEKGLFNYITNSLIENDLSEEKKKNLRDSKEKNIKEGNPQASGNSELYKKIIYEDFSAFVESDKKIKIYNPDYHPVSKGISYKNTTLDDMSVAEKTRIICERIFSFSSKLGMSEKARYLIVFEEAHSLVPEWNSIANEGDKNATNGTAKVILQGRKFGLGSLIITQRTANVSKSILNQCNTIFALRVFDDTGKSFLENYIGSDYANTLPTLEERYAIAIGRGLKLKQPVIIQLNDMKFFKEEQQSP